MSAYSGAASGPEDGNNDGPKEHQSADLDGSGDGKGGASPALQGLTEEEAAAVRPRPPRRTPWRPSLRARAGACLGVPGKTRKHPPSLYILTSKF